MKSNGLTFASLLVIAITAASCSSNWTDDNLVETSPTIEITVAETPIAAQTRQEMSGGIGVISEYGLIAMDELTGKTLCDNLTIRDKSICVGTGSWNNTGKAIVYFPFNDEVEYLEEKGTFMIPFDMAASGQTPKMSHVYSISRKFGAQSIQAITDKLTSTVNVTIREKENSEFEAGHIIINKVIARYISTKGFYVFDSNTGNGHWENQKGHTDISLSDEIGQSCFSFEAIPEIMSAKHSISLMVSTENFLYGNSCIDATENKTLEFSLCDLLGIQSLEPGVTYNAEIELDLIDFLPTIEFSSSVSGWNVRNISVN